MEPNQNPPIQNIKIQIEIRTEIDPQTPRLEDVAPVPFDNFDYNNDEPTDLFLHLSAYPVAYFGFDVMLWSPILPKQSRLLAIRRGPFKDIVFEVDGPAWRLIQLPLYPEDTEEHSKKLELCSSLNRQKHPIWNEHPTLWMARATLWMLHVCRSIRDIYVHKSERFFKPYRIAAEFLNNNFEDGPSTDEECDELAESLHQHIGQMIHSILNRGLKPYDPNATRPTPHSPVNATAEEIANALESIDGVLWIDERAADYIQQLPGGAAYAKKIRSASRKRLEDYQANPSHENAECLFSFWIERNNKPLEPFVLRLAEILWLGTIKPRFRSSQATPRNRVEVNGETYATIAKQSESIAWAFGTHGEASSDITGEYARLPWLVPRSRDIRLDKLSRSPATLPICPTPNLYTLDSEEDERSLPIVRPNSPGFVISPRTSKTLIFMTACGREEIVHLSLGELAKKINPQSKRIQKRDIQYLIEDLKTIDTLRVLTPRRSTVGLFIIDVPPSDANAQFKVKWKFNEFFLKEIEDKQRGGFMVNLSGLMSLSAETDISAFRSYLLACYLLNNSHANDWQVRPIPILEWAARTNSLRTSSIESLTSTGRRRHLSEDLLATFEGLKKLQERSLIYFNSTRQNILKETDTVTIQATADLKQAHRSRLLENKKS